MDCKNKQTYGVNGRRGMTIIEVLIATATISTLMSLFAFVGTNVLNRAKVRAAKADISSFGVALSMAYEDTGVFPTKLADIRSSDPPTGVSGTTWHGPYAKHVPLQDPWGNDYYLYFDITAAFGAAVFERTAGEVYDETFSFSAEEGLGTLNVVNNDVSHAAKIWINGEQICFTNDFQSNIPTISRTVELHASNTIRIWIASNPGSSLNVSVSNETISGVTYHLGSFGKDGLPGGTGCYADVEYGKFNGS